MSDITAALEQMTELHAKGVSLKDMNRMAKETRTMSNGSGNNTALATTATNAVHAFEPSNANDAINFSRQLVASGFLPKSITKPEQAFAIIVTGRELGLTAMQSLRGIHIIEGKPTLSADTMAALVKRSPECVYFRMVESSAERAVFETQRRGSPEPVRLSFTMDEAKAAKLTDKDNWKKYPAAMLRARCIAALARAEYQDLMLGVYDPDELSPTPSPVSAINVTATVQREPEPQPVAALPAAPPAPASGPKLGDIDESTPVTIAASIQKRIESATQYNPQLRDAGKLILKYAPVVPEDLLVPLRKLYDARKRELNTEAA